MTVVYVLVLFAILAIVYQTARAEGFKQGREVGKKFGFREGWNVGWKAHEEGRTSEQNPVSDLDLIHAERHARRKSQGLLTELFAPSRQASSAHAKKKPLPSRRPGQQRKRP